MTPLADYQRRLLEQLVAVNEQLKALRDEQYLLRVERQRIAYMLRNCGYQPPVTRE